MKEVGIRKVIGARRNQLFVQFIMESLMIALSGMMLAIFLTYFLLPLINQFTGKELHFPLTLDFGVKFILFCLGLGVLAGSYPAIYVSGFVPAFSLFKSGNTRETFTLFRQGLVVVQFMLSFLLITGSIIVINQHNFLRNKDLGFNKEQLMVIPLRSNLLKNPESTKQQFINSQYIQNASICFGLPGDIIAGDEVIEPVTNKTLPCNLFCVDYDYISTLGMELIAGRGFSRDFPTDEKEAFVINETQMRELGIRDPEKAIGKRLQWKIWGKDSVRNGEIIGVLKDFNYRTLREKVEPVVMIINPQAYWKLLLRVRPGVIPEAVDYAKNTYEKLDPEWPFNYQFLDNNFEAMYRNEEKLSALFSIATWLAIGIACMGLFGLIEYHLSQRMKEIGIRKVFGAGLFPIIFLLAKRYFILIMISFIIIIPVNYYFANRWLSNFAFHIGIQPMLFVKAALVISAIASFTICIRALKAARLDPAKVLKYE
jgi:putative ABC transport system permease protein